MITTLCIIYDYFSTQPFSIQLFDDICNYIVFWILMVLILICQLFFTRLGSASNLQAPSVLLEPNTSIRATLLSTDSCL
jgi:hypothetical protein